MDELRILSRLLLFPHGSLQIKLLTARKKELEIETTNSDNPIKNEILEEYAAIEQYLSIVNSGNFLEEIEKLRKKHNILLLQRKKENKIKPKLISFPQKSKQGETRQKNNSLTLENENESVKIKSKPENLQRKIEPNKNDGDQNNKKFLRFSNAPDVLQPHTTGYKLNIPGGKYIIAWQDVVFDNRFLTVKISNKKYIVKCKESRKSFEIVKSLFIDAQPNGLTILIRKSVPYAELNPDILESIKSIASSSDFNFSQFIRDDVSSYSSKKHNTIDSLLIKDYKYGKYLCENYNKKYPIIAIDELYVYDAENTNKLVPGLIFIFTNSQTYYFVFESLRQNSSTYIFRTKKFEGEKDEFIQKILAYFAGKSKNKRSSLRVSKDLQHFLGFYKAINHNHFYEWRQTLENIFRYS